MKRLMTYETFVPKRVADRADQAKTNNVFIYSKQQKFLLADGLQHKFRMKILNQSSITMHSWQAVIYGPKAIENDSASIYLFINLKDDFSKVFITYQHNQYVKHAQHCELASPAELTKLANRIAMQLVDDLYIKGVLELNKRDKNDTELYQLFSLLQPKVERALKNLLED